MLLQVKNISMLTKIVHPECEYSTASDVVRSTANAVTVSLLNLNGRLSISIIGIVIHSRITRLRPMLFSKNNKVNTNAVATEAKMYASLFIPFLFLVR